MPTQTAAMCSRPRSSTRIAILKPSPSAPSRLAAGTGASSKLTSQTWAPCWPIFFSGLPIETPGRSAGHEEGRDAVRALPAGARHHREQRRLVGIGDEALGAGQHIDVAVAHRAGLHRGAVRAGARLGQREAGDDLAARDARQPFGLLRVGAGHDQALAADPDIGAEDRAEGRRGPAELERDPHLLGMVRPRPPYSSGIDRPNRPISRISRTISSGTSSSSATFSSSGRSRSATKRRTVSISASKVSGSRARDLRSRVLIAERAQPRRRAGPR